MSNDEKPAFRLATKVVDCLISEGLFRSVERDQLVSKIANGSMEEEDWNLEIKLATTEENGK